MREGGTLLEVVYSLVGKRMEKLILGNINNFNTIQTRQRSFINYG